MRVCVCVSLPLSLPLSLSLSSLSLPFFSSYVSASLSLTHPSHLHHSRGAVKARTHGDEQKEISKRYGKWKAAVAKAPVLAAALKETGKQGLELFHYEPRSDLPNGLGMESEPYVCVQANQETAKACHALGL